MQARSPGAAAHGHLRSPSVAVLSAAATAAAALREAHLARSRSRAHQQDWLQSLHSRLASMSRSLVRVSRAEPCAWAIMSTSRGCTQLSQTKMGEPNSKIELLSHIMIVRVEQKEIGLLRQQREEPTPPSQQTAARCLHHSKERERMGTRVEGRQLQRKSPGKRVVN